MAVTTIVPIALTLNTATADEGAISGTQIVTGADGGSIDLSTVSYLGRRMLINLTDDSSGDDVTIAAGDRPPSQLADLGALVITIAASDRKTIVIEIARFLKSDETILLTAAGDASISVAAYILPRNA